MTDLEKCLIRFTDCEFKYREVVIIILMHDFIII